MPVYQIHRLKEPARQQFRWAPHASGVSIAKAKDYENGTVHEAATPYALWLALRDASAARLAEVERAAREYLGEEVEAIGREELIARLKRGDAVLVDVRPEEEYAAGHIDGARSIPIYELERRLDELPEDRAVIAYCRGPFCAYAHEAVRTLERSGRQARRLEDGWPEWKLQQLSASNTT